MENDILWRHFISSDGVIGLYAEISQTVIIYVAVKLSFLEDYNWEELCSFSNDEQVLMELLSTVLNLYSGVFKKG